MTKYEATGPFSKLELKAPPPRAELDSVSARIQTRMRPASPVHQGRKRSGGFTLLELLIALALISFVASIAIPAYFNRDEVTLENAATLLARDLRSAQNRAAYLSEAIEFTFDTSRPGYRVWTRGRSSAEDPGTYERRYERDAIFEGVELETSGFEDSPELVFNATGRLESAGSVTLRYRGHVRVVEVEAPSGRIVIRNSSSGWRDHGFDH